MTTCAPEPVFRLQNDLNEQKILAHRGMEYLISEKEKSRAILAYYRHLNGSIIMDLEVTNFSNEIVRFEPSDFLYKAYMLRFVFDKHPDDGNLEEYKIEEGIAFDPEEAILNIDIQHSRALANHRTNNVLEGISAGFGVVSDISAAGRESENEWAAREAKRTRETIERSERREHYHRHVSGLSKQRAYWETDTIRTTDLVPGESIAGEILFPVNEDARIFRIFVTVGDDIHEFKYRQYRHKF